jgi:DNA-3-methyladenine glycosylase II
MINQFAYLQKDKKLFAMLQSMQELKIEKRKNVFLQLTRSVAGQQLSTKAAHSIFQKFLAIIPDPTPQSILALNIEQLRAVGFSYNKGAYIQHIAQFWLDENISDKTFTKLSDEQIIEYLTQIKGVGKWTVEMLLMFTLGRQNVFAVDDLGIQQAMCRLYGWDETNKKEMKIKMLATAKTYAPFSTLVCMYLWKWKDDKKNTM